MTALITASDDAPDREWAELVITEMSLFPAGRFSDLTDSTSQAARRGIGADGRGAA